MKAWTKPPSFFVVRELVSGASFLSVLSVLYLFFVSDDDI